MLLGEKMKVEPKILAGFMELLPKEQILFNKMKNIIASNFERFGFFPLDSPILESSEVLLAKAGGETEKQIYQFEKGDNKLCMRFDLTVPLARFVAGNFNQLTFPFRRYQIGKVYRGERPQKGRFREFYQCDIDIVGRDVLDIKYDAEIPSVIYNIFRQLEIGEFKICISNRKLLKGLFEEINMSGYATEAMRIIDKFDKIGLENVMQTLKLDLNLNDTQTKIIIDFICLKGDNSEIIAGLKNMNISNQLFQTGISELEDVVKYMQIFGIPKQNYHINLAIARGLDYYTGTVFETFIIGKENLGSICSGGRYDDLASFYSNQKLPGVGMSIGLTRLFAQFKENNMLSLECGYASKVVIIPMGDTIQNAIEVCNTFRESGINCEVYLQETKFKNKILYATRNEAPYIMIIGDDEVAQNKVTLKNLKSFEQSTVSIDEAIKIVKK